MRLLFILAERASQLLTSKTKLYMILFLDEKSLNAFEQFHYVKSSYSFQYCQTRLRATGSKALISNEGYASHFSCRY